MSKLLGWSIGIVLVFGMYALNMQREQIQDLNQELVTIRAENIQLRQQKALADETAESARLSLEAIRNENKIYKDSIEKALQGSPVWAGTLLPDDLAGLLNQNYCNSPGAVPAP